MCWSLQDSCQFGSGGCIDLYMQLRVLVLSLWLGCALSAFTSQVPVHVQSLHALFLLLVWCWGQCRCKTGVRALSYPLGWQFLGSEGFRARRTCFGCIYSQAAVCWEQWKALLSHGSPGKAGWRLVPGVCSDGNRGLTYFLEVWIESYAHSPLLDRHQYQACLLFSCHCHKLVKSCQKLQLT